MSLQSSDLFYVQRPAGLDAGSYKMQASEFVDFIAGASGSLTYRGTVDCTLPVGAHLEENPPIIGDIYINTGTGTVDTSGVNSTDSWVGIGGDALADGHRVVWDGATWAIVGQESGGLESVRCCSIR